MSDESRLVASSAEKDSKNTKQFIKIFPIQDVVTVKIKKEHFGSLMLKKQHI